VWAPIVEKGHAVRRNVAPGGLASWFLLHPFEVYVLEWCTNRSCNRNAVATRIEAHEMTGARRMANQVVVRALFASWVYCTSRSSALLVQGAALGFNLQRTFETQEHPSCKFFEDQVFVRVIKTPIA